jgi:hypothetical protein
MWCCIRLRAAMQSRKGLVAREMLRRVRGGIRMRAQHTRLINEVQPTNAENPQYL